MENHVQTIVCPNCGASATNHQNCEYCGSLLVRLVGNTTPGLSVESFKQSFIRLEGGTLEHLLNELIEGRAQRLSVCKYWKGKIMHNFESSLFFVEFNDANELELVMRFTGEASVKEALNNRFLSIPESALFTNINKFGNFGGYVYSINYGQDVKSAAHIISKLTSALFGLTDDSVGYVLNRKEESISKLTGKDYITITQPESRYLPDGSLCEMTTVNNDGVDTPETPKSHRNIQPETTYESTEIDQAAQRKGPRSKGAVILLIAGIVFILLYLFALITEGYYPEDLILLIIGIVLLLISAIIKSKKKTLG